MDIKRLIRKEVLEQRGYQAEVPSCRVKMDAMENPFTLSPSLKNILLEEMKKVSLNRYPEPGAPLVRKRFAQYYGVTPDMVIVGNGSDELIQILCTALANSASVVMIPTPTFAMYRIIALNCGRTVIELPLDSAFDLDLDATLDQISMKDPALVFISYPNNPTGNCFNEKKIEAIIAKSSGIVVIDEAYSVFSGKTLLPLLKKYDNMVILKTLSKLGLAAMRIGFLIGSADLVYELDKIRLPYNINSMSQVAAGFFLDQNQVFLNQVEDVVKRREELLEALRIMNGVSPYPSEANFILFRCDADADRIHRCLIERGVLIKNINGPGVLSNCLRVTVGNREENEEFIEALKSVVAG